MRRRERADESCPAEGCESTVTLRVIFAESGADLACPGGPDPSPGPAPVQCPDDQARPRARFAAHPQRSLLRRRAPGAEPEMSNRYSSGPAGRRRIVNGDADSLEGPSSGSSEDLRSSSMQNITKRLALFAASAGVALTGLGVLGTAAVPPGPTLSVADVPPGPTLSVADVPPGPGAIGPEI